MCDVCGGVWCAVWSVVLCVVCTTWPVRHDTCHERALSGYICKRLINALLSPCPLTAPHVPPLMCLIGPGCGVLSVLLLEMSDHC
jgi:hypothetical protein